MLRLPFFGSLTIFPSFQLSEIFPEVHASSNNECNREGNSSCIYYLIILNNISGAILSEPGFQMFYSLLDFTQPKVFCVYSQCMHICYS